MSDEAVARVRQHSKATKTTKHVLLTYAFYAKADCSDACPSPVTVAEEIGITPRAVYQHLQILEEMGEIRHDGKSKTYRTPSYTILPNIAQNMSDASQTAKQASIEAVCLSDTNSIPSVVKEDNRQTEYREADFSNCEAGFTFEFAPDETEEVKGLVRDLAEYDVTGSHVVKWARRIVQRPDWQSEVADILDYWDDEANSNLKEGWIAAQTKQLAYMSPNTPRRMLKIIKGGGDRAAPVDEFEAARQRYGGFWQAQQETDYDRAVQ